MYQGYHVATNIPWFKKMEISRNLSYSTPQICEFSESALNFASNDYHLSLIGPSLTDICKVEVGKI